MICKDCRHVFINELVDVCEFGYGDNITEYLVCPKCGHKQKVQLVEMIMYEGEKGHV